MKATADDSIYPYGEVVLPVAWVFEDSLVGGILIVELSERDSHRNWRDL